MSKESLWRVVNKKVLLIISLLFSLNIQIRIASTGRHKKILLGSHENSMTSSITKHTRKVQSYKTFVISVSKIVGIMKSYVLAPTTFIISSFSIFIIILAFTKHELYDNSRTILCKIRLNQPLLILHIVTRNRQLQCFNVILFSFQTKVRQASERDCRYQVSKRNQQCTNVTELHFPFFVECCRRKLSCYSKFYIIFI